MKILLLHVQGLQLHLVGFYGNEWALTPNLDRLAASSIVFDRHFATYPKLAQPFGLLSGRFHVPHGHGERHKPDLFDLLKQADLYAQRIDATQDSDELLEHVQPSLDEFVRLDRGVLMIDCPVLYPPWRIADGILDVYFGDDVNDDESHQPVPNPPLEVSTQDDSLFVRLQDTYAAKVTELDDLLTEIVDLTETHDDWATVFVASSGLALGEHGYVGQRRPHLYEEVVHVPFLLRMPAKTNKSLRGTRVSALTQTIDLLPTLLELLELPVPPMHGRSLLPLLDDPCSAFRPYACSTLQVDDEVEWCLRTPEWAFLMPADPSHPPRLFAKPEDRWEVNDMRQQQIELCDTFEQTLRDFIKHAAESVGPFDLPLLPEPEGAEPSD